MLLSILIASGIAEPFIHSISEEIDLQMGGTWSIPMHDGYQWWFAMGQGSDLLIAPLFEDLWYVDMAQVQNLSNVGILNDHSFRQCSDGSYLHLSGGEENGPNYIFRYSEHFSLLSQGVFEQGSPPHATNDVPAICGDTFDGFGIAEAQGRRDFFNDVDNSATVTEQIEIPNSPRMTGAGLLEVNEQLIVAGMDPGPGITISVYDPDFEEVARHEIQPFSEEILHYWPSRIERVQDYYIVATMGRDPTAGFTMDTGDIYLIVLDEDFQVQEWHQLSFNDPAQGGGMRPWFDIYEDQLVIGYDKINSLYLFTATLNVDQFTNPEDIEETPSEPTVTDEKSETGCRSNAAQLATLFLIPCFLRPRDH